MSEQISEFRSIYQVKLESENKSPQTVRCYLGAMESLDAYLKANGRPTEVDAITRDDIRGYMADQLKNNKPATASNRYRALKTLFKWLEEEEHITRTPMLGVNPPSVPDAPPQVMSGDDIKALLKSCEGKSFEDVRDAAILSLLLDTGMRRSEIGNLKVDDVNIPTKTAQVVGKGSRPRLVPFGAKTAYALGRYEFARKKHREAHRPEFWLGHAGAMTPDGIYQTVRKRAEQAGVSGVYTHLFRHSFAHLMKLDGYSEENLMQVAGWRSPQMLRRYGASAANERARESFKSHSPRDKF